jgi:hypothetical protein
VRRAALCAAPEEGSDIAELMQFTGMGRSTIYRYLGQLADEGRAAQVGWGHWRAATPVTVMNRRGHGSSPRSRALIESRDGVIVAGFFDVDKSRSIPWQRRPETTALLAELKNPARDFDAVVIGEPHWAFYGNQYPKARSARSSPTLATPATRCGTVSAPTKSCSTSRTSHSATPPGNAGTSPTSGSSPSSPRTR